MSAPPLDEPPERTGPTHRLGGKGIIYRSRRGPDPHPDDLAKAAHKAVTHTLSRSQEARNREALMVRLRGAYLRTLARFRQGQATLADLHEARIKFQAASGTLDRFKALR